MEEQEQFQKLFDNYAEIALSVGVNVQPGQRMIVQAPVSAASFVHKLVEKAYERGVREVYVDYCDEALMRLKYLKQPEEGLGEFPMWKAKGYVEMAENGAALLQVYAPNPRLIRDAHPDRVSVVNQTRAAAMRAFKRYAIEDKISWSMVSFPTRAWAASVFPNLPPSEREGKLWEYIFEVTRVNRQDPIQAWREHVEHLAARAAILTEKQYAKLHFTSDKTNLTVELPAEHVWKSAKAVSAAGVSFVPNIPTEEVFTVPSKRGVNGTVYSTRPLNYNGVLIEDFSFTFQGGEVVDFTAAKGREMLKKLLETDEGARFLGEVAIVPHDSPISNTGVLFYNTLYDENASCHLALGFAIPSGVKGGVNMTRAEREARGLNDSLVHVDFMIGSANLDIDGERRDGEREPILRNGRWAF